MKIRRNRLTLCIVTSLCLAGTLAAGPVIAAPVQSNTQDQSGNQGKKPKAEKMQKVVVLGSLIPTAEIRGAAPVVTVTGAQIKKEGFTTLWEFMHALPQNFAPEWRTRVSTWGNSAVNARPINLRGLGSDHSLLLINGRRVADYPMPGNNGQETFQNYNNIPTGMIDRVEILASGASSIYGSDAVAGVVNVILKKRYQGDDLKVTLGGATRGGRRYGDVNFTGGRSGDNWHIVYNFEHTNRSALWGRDRPYTDASNDAGYGAWGPDDRLFGHSSGDSVALINNAGNYISPPAGTCNRFNTFQRYEHKHVATSGNQVDLSNITDQGASCIQQALFRNWVLTPGLRSNDFYVNGDYDFDNGLTAYGSAGLWDTVGITNSQLPFFYPRAGLPTPLYDKTTGQVITTYVRQLERDEVGDPGNTRDYEQNWDIHAGLKGTMFDDRFDWDLNVGTNKYIVHEHYTALTEQGMFDFFFGQQQGTKTINGVTYPVYALNTSRFYSPITPQQYRTFAKWGINSAYTWMDSINFNVNGDLFDLWNGKTVEFAGVLQANHKGYKLAPDPRGNNVVFSNPWENYITGSGTRNRYSAAAELRVPVLRTLTWGISGRLDKYVDASIADIARTWGTTLEWRPVPSLLVRGTYGTNFHAPDMEAIYLNQAQTTVGDYADPLACIKSGDHNCVNYQHSTYFTQYSGGSRNLLPETGHSWTAGIVWDVYGVPGLTLSADYWRMGIDNAIKWIGLNQALTDEAGCLTGLTVSGSPYVAHGQNSDYCREAIANVQRDANGNILSVTTGPINEASLYVAGVDAKVDYVLRTEDWGYFDFNLNYTDNLTFEERDNKNDPLVNTRYNNPASKIIGTLRWHMGPWDASITGFRTGTVRAPNWGGCKTLSNGIRPAVGDADCVMYWGIIKPWITWSGSASYQLTKKLKLGLTVSNIFDRVGDIPYYAGGFEYIPRNQGDTYTGREVFLNLDYKID